MFLRKLAVLAIVLAVAMLAPGRSEASCKLGAKECRCPVAGKSCTEGYWWHCEKVGADTAWVNKKTKCKPLPKLASGGEEDQLLVQPAMWPTLAFATDAGWQPQPACQSR